LNLSVQIAIHIAQSNFQRTASLIASEVPTIKQTESQSQTLLKSFLKKFQKSDFKEHLALPDSGGSFRTSPSSRERDD
jgi:hypothetical protein